MTEQTSHDYLRAAFQALLRGDTAERDRLCREAESAIHRERRADTAQQAGKRVKNMGRLVLNQDGSFRAQ